MSKSSQPEEPALRVPAEGDIPEIIARLGQESRALWSQAKDLQAQANRAYTEHQKWYDEHVAKQADVKLYRKNAAAGWAAYCQYRYENGFIAPEPLEDRQESDVDLTNTTTDVAEFFDALAETPEES